MRRRLSYRRADRLCLRWQRHRPQRLADMVLWGIVALVVQILTFLMVRMIFPNLVADIPANKVSKGIFLGAVSIAVGILNAACMIY
jgi:putative membrane protein